MTIPNHLVVVTSFSTAGFESPFVIDATLRDLPIRVADLVALSRHQVTQICAFYPLSHCGEAATSDTTSQVCRLVVRTSIETSAGKYLTEDARDASLLVRPSDLRIFAEDFDRVEKFLMEDLRLHDPWNHRIRAPAVFLIYRAARHFAQHPYSAKAALDWLKRHDRYGLFTGHAKALAYAANLINKNPKQPSIEGDELALEKIRENELSRDYSDVVCSNRLSLLLLATDVWLEQKADSNLCLLPRAGLSGYLAGLGFPAFKSAKLAKKREDAGRPTTSTRLSAQENPCRYLEIVIQKTYHQASRRVMPKK